jgi:hypothetical protein
MNKFIQAFAAFIGFLILMPAIALFSGFIAWLIWNHSVSYTLHLPQLGFWQVFFLNWALGIVGGHFRSSCTK